LRFNVASILVMTSRFGFVVALALGAWRCGLDERSPQAILANGSAGGSSGDESRRALVDMGGGPTRGGSGNDDASGSGGSNDGTSAGSGGTSGSGGDSSGTSGTGSGTSGTSGTSGSGGDSSGTSGTSGGGGDSSGTSGAGSTPDVGEVGARVGVCPAFAACGGPLDGVWVYVDVCVDPADVGLDLLQAVCPDATVAFQQGSGGTLTFAAGMVTRVGEGLGQGEITFPSSCMATLGSCAELSALLGGMAGCSQVAGDCVCTVDGSVAWNPTTFQTQGGQLLLGDGRTFDYCVEGDRLTYRETGEALEDGTYTLERN
jgi:hypothetical protein